MKKHYHNIGVYLCVSRLTLVQKNVTVLFPQEGRCEEFVRTLNTNSSFVSDWEFFSS